MALPDISSIHPPAVKVGGRRLSVSSKPKHRSSPEPAPVVPGTPTDYPRPVHHDPVPDNQAPVQAPSPPPHHEEEAPPKKEKKQSKYENEKYLRDLAHRKLEPTRSGKDLLAGSKAFGGAGRIAQPASRAFAL
ncbi:hypothetical protein LshimejAT787_1401850 [Lyophyllum shimeji]|uniref:Uncharacterized protein n=1 Tax=Lyophyllum shimeji TaxID=47721 RepID=A0A9P3USJ3_LYOSH|nr:hypothetical protein LshimejAT787_1401850 [Lyophyllum shimeji]